MKSTQKIKQHLHKLIHQTRGEVQDLTNPGPFAGETEQVIGRPNYMLVGLRAPHVYGFPDQAGDVRITASSDSGSPRRVQRNHSLHYCGTDYKPMTMIRMWRVL